MPTAAPKPCTHIGCPALVRDGTSRCEQHKVAEGSFADARRGSRHARGYGSEWDKLRLIVLSRDCGVCQPCLAEGIVHEGNEVDHRVNKAEWRRLHGTLDGVDDPSNLQAINHDCHRTKTAREGGRGSKNFSPSTPRTGLAVSFLRAQVERVGGVVVESGDKG